METKVGVSVILFNQLGQVLVGKRKGSHGAGLLSVPGGHLEFGETLNGACDRELMEEIGFNTNDHYDKVGFSEDFFVHDGVTKHYITLYFTSEVNSDEVVVRNMEPEKCESWDWVYPQDLPTEMFCDTYDVIQQMSDFYF